MTEPLVVVGDVHGEAGKLQAVLHEVGELGRRIVFLGDYVNRGPSSRGVVELLIRARADLGKQLILLAGNHEVALLRYIDGGDFVDFAGYGGMATIRSYVGEARGDVHQQFRDSIPTAHEDLLRGLANHYENSDVLISHTGFDPKEPWRRDQVAMTEQSHPELFGPVAHELPRPLVVCGHYVQANLQPFNRNGLVCLDTGCGTLGGPLTALLIPEIEFVVI